MYHSSSDGTFSDTDEVARAELLRQCPRRPRQLLTARDGVLDTHRSLLNIACARLWGASVEQVEQQIQREWPSYQDEYHATSARGLPCFWEYDLVSQADVEPSVVLY